MILNDVLMVLENSMDKNRDVNLFKKVDNMKIVKN
jgi:hypothetical protein